jgi:serine/threonine-protein phosphatase PGAM5
VATRTLYLVRHGQYHQLEYSAEEDLTMAQVNQLDGGLTPAGVEQAQLTAQRLSGLPITAIHCSTLPRAIETAEILAQEFPGVPVCGSRMLWECVPSVPPALAGHFANVLAEDLAEDGKSAEQAFDRYFRRARGKDTHEILVGHGNLFRYFVCRLLEAPVESWVNMDSYNCGLSEVHITDVLTLVSYNDVGHLPLYLRT